MKIRYAHTNIIAKNWKELADFYITVFNCLPVPPQRKQTGEWLERGTGVKNASLEGIHLRLPGYGDNGPTLEIYRYEEMTESPPPAANRPGLGHLAFQTDYVKALLQKALGHGAKKVGDLSGHFVPGVGHITFIYIADPEGNLIELQQWD